MSRIARCRDPARPRQEQTETTRWLRSISASRTTNSRSPVISAETLPADRPEDQKTGTGSSPAGFAGIWAAGAALGSGAASLCPSLSYFRTLACIVPWIWIGCHAENHASRQRPGVPAQTRRPAIGTLGSRTRTVLDDRQFHD